MKHLIKKSLLLLAFCLPLAAAAYDFEVGGVYYITDLWDDFAMVCDQGEDGAHYSGNVTIPASVTISDTTYPVTKINAYAFSNCTELTGVTIPESVTEIRDHSFENCTALSAIELPAGLTEIGTAAFEDCVFTRIDIPAGVTTIKMWAFQNCPNLTDVYCHIADPSQAEIGFNVFALENENYAGRTLHVPAGSVAAYKEAGWGDFFGKIVEM